MDTPTDLRRGSSSFCSDSARNPNNTKNEPSNFVAMQALQAITYGPRESFRHGAEQGRAERPIDFPCILCCPYHSTYLNMLGTIIGVLLSTIVYPPESLRYPVVRWPPTIRYNNSVNLTVPHRTFTSNSAVSCVGTRIETLCRICQVRVWRRSSSTCIA